MNKTKYVIYVVFFFLLSGCVTFTQMENGLNALSGKDERVAFDVLGYPSGKQIFGSDTVYFWSVNSSGVMFLPQTSTTTGMIGNTPVYGTTTYNQAVPVNSNCLIKLVVNSNGKIFRWSYNGNIAGCEHYINRLNNYTKSQK